MKHVPNRSPIYFLYNQYLKNHRKSRLTCPKNQQLQLHFTTAKAREDQLPTLQDLLEVSRSVAATHLQTQQQSIQGLPVTAPGCKNIKPCRFKTSFGGWKRQLAETCSWSSSDNNMFLAFYYKVLFGQPATGSAPSRGLASLPAATMFQLVSQQVCLQRSASNPSKPSSFDCWKLIENSGFKLSRRSA